MEFKEVLAHRYSCRKYEERPVPRELLAACVEAGRLAPSGCNLQQWMFIAVDDPEKKAQLAEVLRDEPTRVNTFADRVPAFIVIVKRPAPEITGQQVHILELCGGPRVLDIDIGCAAMQICLAATDMGLGTVIMGKVDQEMMRKALDIPAGMEVPVVIGIGYPVVKEPRPRPRRSLDDIFRWNNYELL